jgi:hypothetical protein
LLPDETNIEHELDRMGKIGKMGEPNSIADVRQVP